MSLRAGLVALVVTGAFVPAQPASAALVVPCIDLGLVKAGACEQPGVPGGGDAQRCADADLVPTRTNLTLIRRSTLCLLNGERASRGLAPLREQGTLRSVASRYARQMVRGRFFSHEGKDGSTMSSRIRRTSYLRGARSWSLGENLAWGTGERATPARTVRSWMDSPGHRRNVLDGAFREVGIGVTIGAPVRGALGAGAKATYVTEFGRRR